MEGASFMYSTMHILVEFLFSFLSKLHVAGKTDQAKADLSRLAKIRADREAAAEKRKAEAEGYFDMLSCMPSITDLSLSLAKKSELEAKQKASR